MRSPALNYEILFATADAEDELRTIFLDSDMDIAGDIHEHVLVMKDGEIIGGGMLAQTGADVFHLLVFAVKEGARKHGIGSILLKELIARPWQYCLDTTGIIDGCYKVTTVAKGQSAEFYRKNGFVACDFIELADPYCVQCRECPELDDCGPVAMVYAGCSVQGENNDSVKGTSL